MASYQRDFNHRTFTHRPPATNRRRRGQEEREDELLVFGYSATLHHPPNPTDEAGTAEPFDEDKHMIPWNGDERLRIDRCASCTQLPSLEDVRKVLNLEFFPSPTIRIPKFLYACCADDQQVHPLVTPLFLAPKTTSVSSPAQPTIVVPVQGLMPRELIPKNVLIRYDVRLYLNSLEEFDKNVTASKRQKQRQAEEEEEEEQCQEETLEEELCEEQRYADLRQREFEEEEAEKRERRGAEIGFTYEDRAVEEAGLKLERKEDEEELDREEDEPFVKPESLKLPTGIDTPATMRQNALIERTAAFVVSKGPQMEVLIRAKQRHRAEQFDFLDFDHRLHAYYKFMCKLIREKKYTPNLSAIPRLTVKKAPISATSSSESNSSEGEDDGTGGYLHPLLRGSTAAKKVEEKPADPNFIGPMAKPVQQPQKKKGSAKAEDEPDLATLVQQFHQPGNLASSSLYSSLMKGLHSVLPKKEEAPEEAATKLEGEETRKSPLEDAVQEREKGEQQQVQLENDWQKVLDYNRWHQDFYGRPSPYLPGPPPKPQAPLAGSVVESGIAIAAKYVALHGAAAEQRLIEHNGDKVHFLLARSPYYTFYQSRLRQLQWQFFRGAQQQPMPPIYPGTSTSATGNATFSQKLQDEEEKELKKEQEEDGLDELTDKKQLERREKARLFMERILNQRMAAKCSPTTASASKGSSTAAASPGERRERRPIASASHGSPAGTAPAQLDQLQLSKTISSIIDQQIRKTLGTGRAGPSSTTAKSSTSTTADDKKKRRPRSPSSSRSESSDSDDERKKRRKKRRSSSSSDDAEDRKKRKRREEGKESGTRQKRRKRRSTSSRHSRRHQKQQMHGNGKSSSSKRGRHKKEERKSTRRRRRHSSSSSSSTYGSRSSASTSRSR